jgi:Uma2 family endonuclease
VVTRVVALLDLHVRGLDLGRVYVSPIDVVLDPGQALILQPDVIFVAHERSAIVRQQVWGAPDLVVEVESIGTRRRDRTSKLRWYRQYGAREYWLIDPRERAVTVIELDGARLRRRRIRGLRRVVSAVLPGFRETAASFFE